MTTEKEYRQFFVFEIGEPNRGYRKVEDINEERGGFRFPIGITKFHVIEHEAYNQAVYQLDKAKADRDKYINIERTKNAKLVDAIRIYTANHFGTIEERCRCRLCEALAENGEAQT